MNGYREVLRRHGERPRQCPRCVSLGITAPRINAGSPPSGAGAASPSRRSARPSRDLQFRVFVAVSTVAAAAHQLHPHL